MTNGSYSIIGAMRTHVGKVRSENEDHVTFVLPSNNDENTAVGTLALVADGMGGHAAGGMASLIAAEVIREFVYNAQQPRDQLLSRAFITAHQAIINYANRFQDVRGMGTTCTAILIHNDILYVAHVGDSRAYLLRDRAIRQITEDQTVVAEMVRSGTITPEEAVHHPKKHILLQALGVCSVLNPSTFKAPLQSGDQVVLCSDGLYGTIKDDEIALACCTYQPHEACTILLEEALLRGGVDNISIGIFRVGNPGGPSTGKTTRTDIVVSKSI